jgi:hypothetical protein
MRERFRSTPSSTPSPSTGARLDLMLNDFALARDQIDVDENCCPVRQEGLASARLFAGRSAAGAAPNVISPNPVWQFGRRLWLRGNFAGGWNPLGGLSKARYGATIWMRTARQSG